ncbi:ATP synthase subunit delta [Citrus sinensis]|nr:ATP synthase subunit delta [Citrus sinensis]
MSVLPGHASIIAVLKSGVLSVHEGNEGLAEFTQKLSLASTNLEKAEAQIGVDVHVALNSALTGKC